MNIALVAEAYSFDAIGQLGYLAARTSTIELGSGVVPIYTRTPHAAGDDRRRVGLRLRWTFPAGHRNIRPAGDGGLHGVPFDAPLGRTREVVEIRRQVWRRERVEHQGKAHQIPLPADRGTGLGSR